LNPVKTGGAVQTAELHVTGGVGVTVTLTVTLVSGAVFPLLGFPVMVTLGCGRTTHAVRAQTGCPP
jgi:hypothetical protein